MRKITLLVGLAILTFISVPRFVFAAEAEQEIGLALRPAIVELATEPGTTVSATIFIQNISKSPVGVEVSAQSLIPNDPDIDQQKRKDIDASTWLIDKGRKFLLDVGEQRSVDVQFLVPENAGPGGHYAMVTFTTTSTQQQSAPGSIVTPTLTSLAFINVAGDVQEEATIEQLNAPFFVFGEDQTLSFNIANTGNTHILPTATVKLYDRSDRLVDSISVPPQLILPNTVKSYNIEWSTGGRIGLHRVEIDLSYGSPTQFASLNTGTIVFLPNFVSLLFFLSLAAISMLAAIFILKKPIRRLLWHFKGIRIGPRILKKNQNKSENKPQDMARLSMDSSKIDDLLSSASGRKPRQISNSHHIQRRKKKKFIIR